MTAMTQSYSYDPVHMIMYENVAILYFLNALNSYIVTCWCTSMMFNNDNATEVDMSIM